MLVDTDISMAVPAGTCMFFLSFFRLSTFFEVIVSLAAIVVGNASRKRKADWVSIANTDGRIAPRSGLASKHMIDTGAGVIDADYRGQVKVLLFNHGEKDFEVKEGDRIAQLVLERIYTPEVKEVEELEESVRGAGGFGSTG